MASTSAFPVEAQFRTIYWPKWGGVNNTLADELIDESELSDARNYQPDFSGTGWLIKREGLTQSSNAITTTTYSVYQGKLANYCHSGTVIKNFAGANLATGMTAAFDDWTSFSAADIFVNGTDVKSTTDGANFASVSGWPSGVKYVAGINNFCYFSGHDKGKLRWCDLGTLTATSTNELVLTQDENDDIAGIDGWRTGLLILTTKSHGMVIGDSNIDQQVSYWSKSEGLAGSHRSVVITPFGAFWWTKNGIARCGDDFSLDYPMRRKLSATLAGLNRGQDANIHGVWDATNHRVCYWLFNGANQTTCNLRADYYPEYDAFFLHSGAAANMSASGSAIVSGVTDVYVGGYANSTYLYKQTGNTDDGANIASYLETKYEGDPSVYRKGRKILLMTDLPAAANVTYACYLDSEIALATGNSWTITVGANMADTVIGHNRYHRKIKHRISDSAATRTRIVQLSHIGYNVRVL